MPAARVQKKAARKKAAKANKRAVAAAVAAAAAAPAPAAPAPFSDVVVEYAPAPLPAAGDGDAFGAVLARFAPADDGAVDGADAAAAAPAAAEGSDSDADDAAAALDDDPAASRATRRARRDAARAALASLKAAAPRPGLVEAWDVSAPDPGLLVALKAVRGSVPVPRHWSAKRAYLQGKRGLDKPPFQLPAYIEATGITEMRSTALEGDAGRSLKAKTRDRVAPKVGRLDIDYQILHDAFFVHATKPPLSGPGDLYYEGKEFETRVDVTPGVLSEALRGALGMAPSAPPPWLINMQRYGPPPSYPRLRIPGLNAPLPPGAAYGYQAGGWGKPPVDADGRALYGDPFGVRGGRDDDDDDGRGVDKGFRWGELEAEAEEEAMDDDDDGGAPASDDDDDDDALADGVASVATDATGLTSVAPPPATGLDLRKGADKEAGAAAAAAAPAAPQPLYTVLDAAPVRPGADGAIMGSDHVYVMPTAGGGGGAAAAAAAAAPASADAPAAAAAAAPRSTAQKALDALAGRGGAPAPSTVDVALDPDELDGLDADAVAALYASRRAAAAAAADDGGVGAVVAARAAAAAAKKGKGKKGKDEFKF